MKLFKVKTSKGLEYNVRLQPISIKDNYKELGINGNWNKNAEIEVNGIWFKCKTGIVNKDKTIIPTVVISTRDKDLQGALGLKLDNDVCIISTPDWRPLYEELLKESKDEFRRIANAAIFSKIKFMYHTTHKYISFNWNAEDSEAFIEFNDKINELKEALKYIDNKLLERYITGNDIEDYSISYYYEMSVSEIEKIIPLSEPGFEKAMVAKENAEIEKRRRVEKDENIKNGAIYFTCESMPHKEDLSIVILNRPAPNGGLYTISHRIPENLFIRIKKFGQYWDRDWLEECDMFFSEPGWRFSVDAVNELAKNNEVYINNEKYIL